jgi:hypothetical protein
MEEVAERKEEGDGLNRREEGPKRREEGPKRRE